MVWRNSHAICNDKVVNRNRLIICAEAYTEEEI